MFFNEFINNRRKELNMSIDELVEKSGVPKGTLSKITAGISTNPTLSTVELLCSALNCSLNDAVGYIEESKNNITFSKAEIDTIKKYRSLDQFGKKAVDDILNDEYERCLYIEKEPSIKLRCSLLKASAGTGNWLDDEQMDTIIVVDTPEARKADIVIEVDGDSMKPEYNNGDKVLVRLQPAVEIGEVGIFIMDGNGYIKKFADDRLISLNPEYKDVYPTEYGDFRCIGKVIGKAEIAE
ncbi:MAG: helix-turn-helix domain-containing protein [Ruminococcus sp.]|nr:helix-turn-helix domain-containing protein [Ruminococcus sp.]